MHLQTLINKLVDVDDDMSLKFFISLKKQYNLSKLLIKAQLNKYNLK